MLVGVGRAGAAPLAFIVAVAVGGDLVGVALGGVGFVGSGFRDCFVGKDSTSTLATTLTSGVGVSAVWVSPQPARININAAGRRNDIVSLRLISLLPPSVVPNPPWDS